MRRSLWLPFFALLFGLGLGLGVLYAQKKLARELIAALQDELSKACPCELKYDSLHLSLFGLRATASNLRVERTGVPQLRFIDAEAKFSLSDIFQRRVRLTELNLIDGYSHGVGPDSSTFQFIDQLSTPPPPERDTPDRWRVQLERITVRNAQFDEQIGVTEVIGKQVSLDVQRVGEGAFHFTPLIGSLALDIAHTTVLQLGNVDGAIDLEGGVFQLKRIRLANGDAHLITDAEVLVQPGSPMQGSGEFLLNDRAVDFSRFMSFILYGSGTVGGRLARPEYSGSFSNPSEQPLLVHYGEEQPLEFAHVEGDVSLAWVDDSPRFSLTRVDANGPLGEFTLSRALHVTKNGFDGTARLNLDSFELHGLTLQSVGIDIEVVSSWSVPRVQVSVDAARSLLGDVDLGPFEASISLEDHVVSFTTRSGSVLQGTGSSARSLVGAPRVTVETAGALEIGEAPARTLTLTPTQISIHTTSTSEAAPQVDASFRIQGPLLPDRITGQGTLQVRAAQQTIDATVDVKDGVASIETQSSSRDLTLKGTIGLSGERQSRLELRVKDFNPLDLLNGPAHQDAAFDAATRESAPKKCGSVTGSLEYRFSITAPRSGEGALDLRSFALGCSPFSIHLVEPIQGTIANGGLQLPNVTLAGNRSSLTLHGRIDPGFTLNLSAQGSLGLASIAPLLGPIDDVRGLLSLDASLSGPLESPQLEGKMTVVDGELDLASSDISLREVSGECSIFDGGVDFANVSGRLNDGTFELSGRIEPFAIEQSVATLRFHDLLFSPSDELTASLSGSLGIGPDREGSSAISGIITIDSAEFRKSLNLAQLLRNTALSLVTPQNVLKTIPSRSSLPSLPLDIRLVAPRNIFIDTPWASGELKANLKIQGTVDTPQPEGTIDVLSGWIGLKDRRFEITNGRAEFKPFSLDPTIDLLAETTIRTRQGDVLLVFLEASGVASAPRLRLTSDRGLSETEILSVFTSRSDIASSSSVSNVTGGFEVDTLEFIEDYSFLGLGRLVRDLARIDSLSIEPTFSVQRGTVEPTLVATKRVFDHLSLVGQTLIGSTSNESSLKLVYDASPALELSGVLDTYTQNRGSSAGVDLTYTLLGERRRFLDIRISGNRIVRSLDIQDALRLNEDSRLNRTELDRVSSKIVKFYASRGFFSADVSVSCGEVPGFTDGFCHQLLLKIDEGSPTYIDAVSFEGTAPPEFVSISSVERSVRRSVASEEERKAFERRLINALRNEGYISARVSTSYIPTRESDSASVGPRAQGLTLQATVTLGDPVTFVFMNNTVFTASEFLATIDLFGRRQPFGSNTIAILLENMKRMYNERGYLFASASVERTRDPSSERVTYGITLDEGQQLTVSQVRFSGLESISTEDLQERLRTQEPAVAELILHPRFAVPDQLDVNTDTLRRVLEQMGFPEATVSVEPTPHEDLGIVDITYTIVEGMRIVADTIELREIPEGLVPPEIPSGVLAIPQINEFVQKLTLALSDSGYQRATVSTSFADDQHAIIEVDAGPRSVIQQVHIEGIATSSPDVISTHLLVSEGSPLDQGLIQESKRRLLRLGLFNRVNMILTPLDSTEINYSLTVSVQERSLRTVTIGSGANSELGLHLFGEATDRALFGDGRTLTARVDTYYDRVAADISQGIASLTYGDPLLLGNDYTYFSDVRFQRVSLDNQEFDLDRVSFTNYAYLSRTSETGLSGLSWSLGHTIFQEDLTNVSPGAIIGSFDSGKVRLSFLSALINYDQRDDPLNPSRGFTVQGEGTLASQAVGSEANYSALRTKASYLTPLSFLSPRWSFASGSRFGVAWKFRDTDEVPISQRFYLGGRTSVRGFSENSLGPRGFDGAVQGGDLYFAQNLEFRYLARSNTEVLSFFDFGGLFLQDQPMSSDEIRESLGVGLRYLSPIGPIGIDVGFPLDRQGGESSYRVHFNIGTNF